MKALLTKIFSRVGIKKGFNVPLLPTKITKIIYVEVRDLLIRLE